MKKLNKINQLSICDQVIEFDQALAYIDAFLQQFPSVALNCGLGGFISVPELNQLLDDEIQLRIGHYCFDVGTEQLFLAFEDLVDDPTNISGPIGNQFFAPHPNNIIKAPTFGGAGGYKDLVDYLIRYDVKHNPTQNNIYNKASVLAFISAFVNDPKQYFQYNRSHVNSEPFGIFCLSNITAIKNENIIGYRYYFGFDSGEQKEPLINKFRIIFVGVNDRYENIIFTKYTGVYTKGVMIEKSYP